MEKDNEMIYDEEKMEEEAYRYMSSDYIFCWSRESLIQLCLCSKFPGTQKYEPNHPIWDCRIARSISPKEAWESPEYIGKAVDNLIYILNKTINSSKYINWFTNIENTFLRGDILGILRIILNRFTVAKIAPKVTALAPSTFLSIIDKSKIDISNGIYCPMAGFGGIVRGAEEWFRNHKKEPKIEAYDINPIFCNYFGWIQKDVLSDYVKTDKTVFVCPPFGENTERWLGTPDDMYYSFEEWAKLIKEHIDAPQYIIVGPEKTKSHRKHLSGLFQKTVGIEWYPEYSVKNN